MEVKGIEQGEGNHSKEGSDGRFMHSGGWLLVHENNSVEVNLVEAAEREDFDFDKLVVPEGLETESAAGKVASQLQEKTVKSLQRRR